MLVNWNENQIVSVRKFVELLKGDLPFHPRLGNVVSFMGKRVVYGDDRVLLFDHCEYCGQRAHALDHNECCTHCGAPALRDNYGLYPYA